MMDREIRVGSLVVYKGIADSSIYRVAEISPWDEVVMYDATGRGKFSRKVNKFRLEAL